MRAKMLQMFFVCHERFRLIKNRYAHGQTCVSAEVARSMQSQKYWARIVVTTLDCLAVISQRNHLILSLSSDATTATARPSETGMS